MDCEADLHVAPSYKSVVLKLPVNYANWSSTFTLQPK